MSIGAYAMSPWEQEVKTLQNTKASQLCETARNQNTLAAGECYQKAFKKSDDRLNQLYSSHLKTLSAKDQKVLKAAQLGWIKYKDNHCTLVSRAYEGGSWEGILNIQCQIDQTNQRNVQLLKLKNCGMESPANICE